MQKKTHVLLLCGGQSNEHEVSVRSAASVYKAIDKNIFDVSIVGIDQEANWHFLAPAALLEHQGMPSINQLIEHNPRLALADFAGNLDLSNYLTHKELSKSPIDVVFPLLHGVNGEDGAIQGLLRLAKIPFVGSDVLGSAICMDKDFTKRLLRDAGLPTPDFLVFRKNQRIDFNELKDKFGLPFFLKPCNTGSSVGVSKVKNDQEFIEALKKAFQHDQKIIVEKFIPGREIECAVLGNNNPRASVLGEIILHHEFYSYVAKYLDDHGASFYIPAKLKTEQSEEVRKMAIQAFAALQGEGMGRVDFFICRTTGKVYFNEINTIPGFTSISMYPKLWEASGIGAKELVSILIDRALQRYNRKKSLIRDYQP